MPELPEVQTTVDGLRKKVLQRAFIDVWSDWGKIVKKPNFSNFKKDIEGKKIVDITRRGKNIIFELSGGYSLLVHQKMTGHFLLGIWKIIDNKVILPKAGPLSEKINTFLHLIFFLDDGSMMGLSDVRKFAKIELWKKEELENSEYFKNIGPDPLDKGMNYKIFRNIISKKKGAIKKILMDQSLISGVGNIYSDEALWRARIHPLRTVSSLTDNDFQAIYKSIVFVLNKGIELGGESFSDYRNTEGERGNFDIERKVYRREGEKCSICNATIKRIKIGGRSAHFCPNCQQV
jgi:formamidopyrimidine-DNA glycosylase